MRISQHQNRSTSIEVLISEAPSHTHAWENSPDGEVLPFSQINYTGNPTTINLPLDARVQGL